MIYQPDDMDELDVWDDGRSDRYDEDPEDRILSTLREDDEED